MFSCLYKTDIMHYRSQPREHRLKHSIFMFYVDLDELDMLSSSLNGFSHVRRSVYQLDSRDHIGDPSRSIKENVLRYLRTQGVDNVDRIMLMTNMRTFGYSFNPVSFFFCFDRKGRPCGTIVEIGNTFKELKYYWLSEDRLSGGRYEDVQTKYFYISPFTSLKDDLHFSVKIPGPRLDIQINTQRDGKPYVFASMTGKQMPLNNRNLFLYTLMFPFVTLKVIALIHWHAAVLHFKKRVPFAAKEDNPQDQKEVYRV